MAKRYNLNLRGTQDDKQVNWLELFETWKQRARRTVIWSVQTGSDGRYAARVEIDGANVPNIVGYGQSPREAKINVVTQLDKAEPAILTI
ncbi:hypothetical protein FRC12_004885 [Ceratobasidium sp. 428]|nr:hypothetical protein FRC09_015382 [Ceratobasidium sp. 395]KAG8769572.1 hypothetical protein FRC12_004885 [Ceratobasidium sp. 428]